MIFKNSKVYDVLKWVALTGLYGLGILIAGLGQIWKIPYTTQIVATIDLVGVVLGIWLGISSIKYANQSVKEK